MPEVSVIIPSYNRAKLVVETIESVLNQSFQDFEIIVVDDGSTDTTEKVVSNFPIRYIKQENQGLPNARNTGINASQGNYIAILDSDDCLLEGSLEKRVAVLEKYPRVGFTYSQMYIMDENSQITGLHRLPIPVSGFRLKQKELHDLLYVNHIPASTVMIRRSCLDRVGMFNPTFIHGQEDLEMWVRLASIYDSFYIPEPLIKYRLHSNRMTDHLDIHLFEDNHRQIIDSVLNNPEINQPFLPEHDKIYSHLNYFLADVANMKRDMKTMRSYILKALKLYPPGIFSRLGLRWSMMLILTLAPKVVIKVARSGKQRVRRISQTRYEQTS